MLSYSICKVDHSPFFRGQLRLYFTQPTQCIDCHTHTTNLIKPSPGQHIVCGLCNSLQETAAASSSRR
jgi:hypothetical protein